MNRIILGIAVASILAGACRAAEKREMHLDTQQFHLSPGAVIDPKDGTVRLARSWLFLREMGATDHRQTVTLSDRIRASVSFTLYGEAEQDAELFIFGSPKVVEVNRKPVPKVEPLSSTGWSRVRIPPRQLGLSEGDTIRMYGGGQLLFEPSPRPGLSAMSTDGGRNWSPFLDPEGGPSGEFLARLRVKTYGPPYRRGHEWATSRVLDLWPERAGGAPIPGQVLSFESLRGFRGKELHRSYLFPLLIHEPSVAVSFVRLPLGSPLDDAFDLVPHGLEVAEAGPQRRLQVG